MHVRKLMLAIVPSYMCKFVKNKLHRFLIRQNLEKRNICYDVLRLNNEKFCHRETKMENFN
jgi:hypothetical protein